MKSKYYVPNLEELHVGYICEVKNSSDDEYFDWEDQLIEKSDLMYINNWLNWNELRTKYLDVFDLESLGCKYKREYKNNLDFEKGNIYTNGFFLTYNTETLMLKIQKNKGNFDNSGTPKSECVFEGKVKSINELKLIFKMLEI